ncbi:hypothetical protein WDU94_013604 [Cyamophila willieti]
MALNFIEQNITKYFNISNQQYSNVTKSNEVEQLQTENLFVWKLLEAISSSNLKNSDVLWSSTEEEFLIKQWIEYTNTHILHANVGQVLSYVLNVSLYYVPQSQYLCDKGSWAVYFKSGHWSSNQKDLTFQTKEKYQHVSRWFNFIQSLPEVRLGNPVILFSKTPLY